MTANLVAQALNALRHKDYAAALAAITQYGDQNAFELQHYLIKGLSELALSKWAEAEETFTDATQEIPYQAQLWLNLGVAQENLGKLDEAAANLERCLDLDPKQADACGNLSNIYRKQGLFREAEAMAHRAFEGGASQAQALNSLGLALGKQGKHAEAEQVLRRAHAMEETNAHVLSNLANLLVDQLRMNEAWPLFAAARKIDDNPVIRRDEGMARLLNGDYETGWALYDARLHLPTALRQRPACPRYAGESLSGKKLLMLAEQGFGDSIMFCRYGKCLADMGAELVWSVPKSLQRLLSGQVPGHVYAEGDPLPQADYYLPLMSSPRAAQKFAPVEAPAAPYLKAPVQPALSHPLAQHTKRIGLTWSGSPTHERDHERSLLLPDLEPVWKNVTAQFFALSKSVEASEISSGIPIRNLSPDIHDFADTAAFIRQMDVIVSVDTSVAHLAGALGVKTYILLPHCPDWRWGLQGETTPWYPSVTLLRQSGYGDWDSVINRLVAALNA